MLNLCLCEDRLVNWAYSPKQEQRELSGLNGYNSYAVSLYVTGPIDWCRTQDTVDTGPCLLNLQHFLIWRSRKYVVTEGGITVTMCKRNDVRKANRYRSKRNLDRD